MISCCRFTYPLVIGGTAVISILYVLETAGLYTPIGKIIPLYTQGYGWICVAAIMLLLAVFLHGILRRNMKNRVTSH